MAANDEVGKLVVTLGLDSLGFQDGISKISRQMKIVQTDLQATTASFGNFGSETDKLAAKADALTKQLDLQRAKVELLQNAVAKSAAEKGEDARQTEVLTIKLNQARAALAGMEADLKGTNDQLNKLNSPFRFLQGAVGTLGGMFANLGQTMQQAFLYSGVYGGLYAIVSGIKDATGAGIQWDAQMQQMQVGFTTILGSASQAKTMLDQLTAFAQATPFSTTQVEQSAQQMLAMGFAAKQILPDMKSIGDAAAALGLSSDGIQRVSLALGQMLSHGTADAQDMLQLTEAGIPAWQMLADSMGKTVPQLQALVSKGLVPSKQATDALIADMEAKYPNMLGKMNSSFNSEMGNLADAAKHSLGDVMQPLFNWLTNTALPNLNNKLDTFRKTLESAGSTAAFKTLLPPGLVDTINNVADAIRGIFTFIQQNGPLITSIIEGIAAGLLFAGTVTAVEALIGGIEALIVALRGATGVMGVLDAVMDANPIGLVALAIGVLVTAITLLSKAWNSDWDGIREKTQSVGEVIKAVFEGLVAGLKIEFYGLEAAVLTVITAINDMLQPLINLIGKIAPGFAAGFANVKAEINDARQNAMDGLTQSINDGVAATQNLQTAVAGVGIAFSTWHTPSAPGSGGSGLSAGFMQAPHGSTPAPSDSSSSDYAAATAATDAALRAAMASATSTATKGTKAAGTTAGQNLVQGFITGINNELAPFQQTIDQLKARVQFRTDLGDAAAATQAIKEEISAYQKQADAVRNAMSQISQEIGRLNPRTQASDIASLRSQYSQLATEWWNDRDAMAQLTDQINKAKDAANQTAASAFQTFSNGQISAINTALTAELDAMKSAHQQALAAFDAETQQVDAQFQAQLAALNQAQTALNRSTQQSQWDKQSTDLQHQLAVAQLMGDTSTINQVKSQIDQLNQQISDQKQQWAIQDQQKTIQDQQKAYDQQRALQKSALQQQFTDMETEKQKEIQLQQQAFGILQQTLQDAVATGKMTQDQANAAWVQAIKDTGDKSLTAQITAQDNVQKELQKWASQYTNVGKSYGTNLGSGLVAGLTSMLGAVKAAAAQLASAASVAVGTGSQLAFATSASLAVPKLATGGILTRPTLALAGEAGPEAVVPLNDSTMSRLASAIMSQMPSGGGSAPINIYLDGQRIASYVIDLATGTETVNQRKGL